MVTVQTSEKPAVRVGKVTRGIPARLHSKWDQTVLGHRAKRLTSCPPDSLDEHGGHHPQSEEPIDSTHCGCRQPKVLKLFEKNTAIEFVHILAARNPYLFDSAVSRPASPYEADVLIFVLSIASAQLSESIRNRGPLHLRVVSHIYTVRGKELVAICGYPCPGGLGD